MIDREVVMLNNETGEYLGMDLIGSRIWELLSERITLAELLTKLTTEFSVSISQCEIETIDFLQTLREKKLITLE